MSIHFSLGRSLSGASTPNIKYVDIFRHWPGGAYAISKDNIQTHIALGGID